MQTELTSIQEPAGVQEENLPWRNEGESSRVEDIERVVERSIDEKEGEEKKRQEKSKEDKKKRKNYV